MRFSNIYGHSLMLMPYATPKYNTSDSSVITLSGGYAMQYNTYNTDGNEFIFFKGAKPTDEDLYALTNREDLIAAYGADKLTSITDITISWTYTTTQRERIIKKIPIDALDMTLEQGGTIGWCAIICTQQPGWSTAPLDSTKDSILFTDSIDSWNNNNSVITVDTLDGVSGGTIIFKDFSFKLRDKSVFEGV